MVSHQHGPVGEFHNRVDFLEARHLGNPSDSRETGQIDEVVLVAKSGGAGGRACSRPKMNGIGLVAGCPCFEKVLAVSVEFQLKVRIRDNLCRVDAMLAPGCRLFPFLAEEKRRTSRGPFTFSFSLPFSLSCPKLRRGLLREN